MIKLNLRACLPQWLLEVRYYIGGTTGRGQILGTLFQQGRTGGDDRDGFWERRLFTAE